jgi:hypothetical protein
METSENRKRQAEVADDRVWPRIECAFSAECSAFGHQWSCEVVNLSEKGLGIISAIKLKKGDIITFDDPKTKTEVVWAEESRAGLKILN